MRRALCTDAWCQFVSVLDILILKKPILSRHFVFSIMYVIHLFKCALEMLQSFFLSNIFVVLAQFCKVELDDQKIEPKQSFITV